MKASISMLEFITGPLQYTFMVRGLLAAVLVGVVCAVVGTYVVLRGMAFFGDALAHAILPGVAIGYLVSGGERAPLFWWALGTSVITSIGIGAVSRGAKIKEDTAIGIFFAGMFALGIALISTVRAYTVDLTHFLFGNILGVRTIDLWQMFAFGSLIIIVVLAFYKEFLVLSFDPVLARTLRLPAKLLDYLLITLIAIAIVVSLQAVGVALVVAMLVTPAATASLITRRLPVLMTTAAVIAAFSGIIGLYFSYYLDVASGAAIVLTCTAFFVVVWGAQTLRKKILRQA
jgi:manganese/iron transport system permease protein